MTTKITILNIREARGRHAAEIEGAEQDADELLGGDATTGEIVAILVARGWVSPTELADRDAEIARLTAALADAREALRPFAEEAAEIYSSCPDDVDFMMRDHERLGWSDFTAGDLRRAKRALAGETE